MTLRLIGAGFGRTGTWSTFAALNKLGLPSYHMQEVIINKANKGHLDFWRKVANDPPGTQQDWNRVFANYSATVDNPGCCVWRELMVAYPDAKVLLTLHPRGAEAWYESTIDTIYFSENVWQFKILEWLTPFGRKFGDMSHKLVWGRTLKDVMDDRDKAVARYNSYIEEVKAAVPPEKLLVFKVSEGWGPLCDFLGVARPNEPFPNLNDRETIKKIIRSMLIGSYLMLAASVLAAVAVVGALWLWLGSRALARQHKHARSGFGRPALLGRGADGGRGGAWRRGVHRLRRACPRRLGRLRTARRKIDRDAEYLPLPVDRLEHQLEIHLHRRRREEARHVQHAVRLDARQHGELRLEHGDRAEIEPLPAVVGEDLG